MLLVAAWVPTACPGVPLASEAHFKLIRQTLTGACLSQASMGIYLFKRQVLESLLQDKNPSGSGRQDEHFGYDVIPHALRSGAKVCSAA